MLGECPTHHTHGPQIWCGCRQQGTTAPSVKTDSGWWGPDHLSRLLGFVKDIVAGSPRFFEGGSSQRPLYTLGERGALGDAKPEGNQAPKCFQSELKT